MVSYLLAAYKVSIGVHVTLLVYTDPCGIIRQKRTTVKLLLS